MFDFLLSFNYIVTIDKSMVSSSKEKQNNYDYKHWTTRVYIDYKQGGSKNGTSRNIAINSSSLGQNGRHFTDDVFRYIFVNEKFCILINLIRISLKCVLKGPIDNNPALVQIMYWCRIGAIIWTNADPIHWRIYSVLGEGEFIDCLDDFPHCMLYIDICQWVNSETISKQSL